MSKWTPTRNPTVAQIQAIIAASPHKAARRIICERTGDVWVWPFDQATHLQGAHRLGTDYTRPPEGGDVLV
jgi:hypothetical protein